MDIVKNNLKVVRAYLKSKREELYGEEFQGCDMDILSHTTAKDRGTYAFDVKQRLKQARQELRSITPILTHYSKNIFKDKFNASVGVGSGQEFLDISEWDIQVVRALIELALNEDKELLDNKAYLNTKAVVYDTGARGYGAITSRIDIEKI